MSCFLSIIIPAYNEAERIGPTLDQVLAFTESFPHLCEIIVVDDGSQDATAEVASSKLKSPDHRVLKNGRNYGKGYSVRSGMLAAQGKFLLFTDADMSTPIEEVTGFIEKLQSDYDVVIGSRALSASNVEVRQNFLREAMGRIFNRIARLLAFQNVKDSQCGFKCFTQKAARDIFSAQKLDGFSFDAEIVYLAQKKGYRLLEAPVTWRNSPNSRVRIFSDPLRMFADLVKIRWYHRNL